MLLKILSESFILVSILFSKVGFRLIIIKKYITHRTYKAGFILRKEYKFLFIEESRIYKYIPYASTNSLKSKIIHFQFEIQITKPLTKNKFIQYLLTTTSSYKPRAPHKFRRHHSHAHQYHTTSPFIHLPSLNPELTRSVITSHPASNLIRIRATLSLSLSLSCASAPTFLRLTVALPLLLRERRLATCAHSPA